MTIDDTAYFDAILTELDSEFTRRTGRDASSFIDLIRRRLQHGAELYGARAYLTRNNLPEASDEAADLVAYPLFELRKRLLATADLPGDVTQLLFDAMLDAASAELKIRTADRLLRNHT